MKVRELLEATNPFEETKDETEPSYRATLLWLFDKASRELIAMVDKGIIKDKDLVSKSPWHELHGYTPLPPTGIVDLPENKKHIKRAEKLIKRRNDLLDQLLATVPTKEDFNLLRKEEGFLINRIEAIREYIGSVVTRYQYNPDEEEHKTGPVLYNTSWIEELKLDPKDMVKVCTSQFTAFGYFTSKKFATFPPFVHAAEKAELSRQLTIRLDLIRKLQKNENL